MASSPPVYSSISGPARLAAVAALSAMCGGGLVYSLMREPRTARAAPATIKELPARQVAAAPPAPIPSAPLAVQMNPDPAPAAVIATANTIAPTPEAPAPAVSEPAPEPEPPQQPPPPAPSVARLINLNKATQAELELLPRVGPATAKAIISYRSLHGPFRTVQDLDKVKGIGPKTLERLAPLVTVD